MPFRKERGRRNQRGMLGMAVNASRARLVCVAMLGRMARRAGLGRGLAHRGMD